MVAEPSLDTEWLERRRLFCRSRIRARMMAGKTGLEGLVIAGLHRELAAIELLLGQTGQARYALRRAGTLLAAQGLAEGLVLLALAGSHRIIGHPLALDILHVADSQEPEQAVGLDRSTVHSGSLLHSPHQWMSVFLAVAVDRKGDHGEAEDQAFHLLERRLRPQAAAVMPNGLPFATMIDLVADDDGPALADAIELTIAWRRQALRIARQDDYHWRLSLDPARLVDFDLIAALMASIEKSHREVLQRSLSDADPELTRLPLRLAGALYRSPRRRPAG